MYIAIQARAGVPAAGLLSVLQAHGYLVLPLAQERRDVHMECVVAVGPVACFLAVDIHLRLAHRTVEEQFHMRSTGIRLNSGLVPSRPHVGESARAPGLERGEGLTVLPNGYVLQVVLAVERTVNRPIVGNGYFLPSLVLRGRQLMVLLLKGKLPRREQRADC